MSGKHCARDVGSPGLAAAQIGPCVLPANSAFLHCFPSAGNKILSRGPRAHGWTMCRIWEFSFCIPPPPFHLPVSVKIKSAHASWDPAASWPHRWGIASFLRIQISNLLLFPGECETYNVLALWDPVASWPHGLGLSHFLRIQLRMRLSSAGSKYS